MGVKHLGVHWLYIYPGKSAPAVLHYLFWMLWTLTAKLQGKITKIEKKKIHNFMKQIFLGTMCAMMYFYIFGI